jgi:hypothetical protein
MTSDAHMILCPQKNHGFSPNWNTFEQVQKQTNDMCVSSSYPIKKL